MSTVVLKTLEWDRCFSFGNSNKINLNAAPVTQIIAPNGFGKSSIPLILEEVLYNNNSKGVKKGEIPNRLMDGSYKIVHEFSVDNVEYSVTVDRKKSGVKVYLLKEGVDISSHTATDTFKQIKDLLGPDFKVF
jgi:DNA repair exonuclease SbcCD ATPase subunit